VQVPFSKSESNRALIIRAIGNLTSEIKNLSDADDTFILQKLLSSNEEILDAESGGTTARFLLAYCTATQKEKTITGKERLKQRPIKSLIDALTQLGADIRYLEHEGFLPVKISPSTLNKKNKIEIDATQSSQHVSALMMIAPLLPNGLTLQLKGEILSAPYISLTAKVMKHYGADAEIKKNKIIIPHQKYQSNNFEVAGDWSAAAFWFELAALCDSADIFISNLKTDSMQGDEIITEILKPFGVACAKKNNGVNIRAIDKIFPQYFKYDFRNHPDLALPVAAVCGAHAIQSDLYGLQNLVNKESDRVVAFQREAYKLNIKTDFCDCSKLKIFDFSQIKYSSRAMNTYNDHRIAMTFAPLSLLTGKIKIDNPEVVSKSYPTFWRNLEQLGFVIRKI
jgi:3-phosphoshikimate 1-carboxyvinyltransferase